MPKSIIFDFKLKDGDLLDISKDGDIYKISKYPNISNSPLKEDENSYILSLDEIAVLKKIDRIKYKNRDKDEIKRNLTTQEIRTLSNIIKKGYVYPKKKDGKMLYLISDNIYEKFLVKDIEAFNKKKLQISNNKLKTEAYSEQKPNLKENKENKKDLFVGVENFIEQLKNNGYVVLRSSVEAENVSGILDDEIRRGLVLGTRGFNKNYYIVYRSFINKNYQKITDLLKKGDMGINELSKATGIEPDGIRAIMFIVAEEGEIMEKRRDVFSIVE